MSKRKYFITITLFILTTILPATLTTDLLRRETGVRALGMGGAFSAVAEDTSALFYNPAGLARPGSQLYYQDDDLNHKDSLTKAIENGLKLGSVAYSKREFLDDDYNYARIDSYGFGVRTTTGIDWGLTYKKILQEGPGIDGAAWSLDFGTIVNLTPDLRFGLCAQDFSGANLDNKPTYRIGLAKRFDKLLLVYDNENFNPYDTPNAPAAHYGMEYDLTSGFTLRLGNNDNRPTYGVSVGIFGLVWDYAIEHYDKEIIYRFGVKMGDERKEQFRKYALGKKNEFLMIDLNQPLVAGNSEYSFFGGLSLGTDYLLNKIKYAADDPSIKGIIIKVSDIPNALSYVGLVQELRSELLKFKSKGKKIVAYVENEISANSYYLISLSDKIVMSRMGALAFIGKTLTVTRMNGLLKKLGLKYYTFKVGDYKNSLSPFNDGYTEKQKAQIESLVFDLNEQMLTDIQGDRSFDTKQFAEVKLGGIITAKKALEYNLIDQIGYYDKVTDLVKKMAGLEEDPVTIKLGDIPTNELDNAILPNFNSIAIVDIDGEIISGKSISGGLFGGKAVGADSVIELLNEINDHDAIKAVVVRVNSPGGSAIASDKIFQKLLDLKKDGKYIVVSMGNIAASGGYFISCAGDKLFANRGTLTGSIGVIGGMLKGSGLYDKLDLKEENIKTGQHMDLASFGRDLTEEEVVMIESYQKEIYEEFKMIVAQQRDLHIADVELLAQGKIYSGKKAKELGLVDELGTIFDAIEAAKEGAGIKGKAKIVRMFKDENYGWLRVRSKVSTFLGLDSLKLYNINQKDLAQFNSYIY